MKNITEFITEGASSMRKSMKGGKELLDIFTCGDSDPKGYCKDIVADDADYNSTTTYKDANALYKDLMDPTKKWIYSYSERTETLTFRCGRNNVKLSGLDYDDVESIFD